MGIVGRAREGRLERAQARPRSESPRSLQDHCCPVSVPVVTTVLGSFSFFLSVFLPTVYGCFAQGTEGVSPAFFKHGI